VDLSGFSAVSTTLPLPQNVEHEFVTSAIYGNGMNAPLGETVHCIAAEPHATFLRIGVIDEDYRTDIAYTSAVLGRLRRGYRVLQLRNALGTRIELAYLLVHIGFSSETNFWPSPRHVRARAARKAFSACVRILLTSLSSHRRLCVRALSSCGIWVKS
jgi:hypothetical protein